MKITVNSNNAVNKTRRLINGLDFRKPLDEGADLKLKEIQMNFDQQGRLYGGWEKLKDSTKRQRARLGYGPSRPILVRTGRLLKSFRKQVHKGYFVIKSTAGYAKYHQQNGRKGKVIPERKLAGDTDRFNMAFKQIIVNFMNRQIREVGL